MPVEPVISGAGARPRTVGILQPGYLPWLGFFEQLHRCDVFVLYDDVQFEKGGWRNRNRIKTPQGACWLTVPVLLKGRGLPAIREVAINTSEHWQDKHAKTIRQNYQKAPYFEHYADSLFEILRRPYTYLIDLDLALISWMQDQLGISTPVRLSSRLGVPGSHVQRLVDMILALGGTRFYEGSAGRDYIDVETFEKAGIAVTFQDYVHPRYPQLHGEFLSHLSAVDLLFNCGPRSLAVITGD